jgi:hypothetical protein
MDANNDDAAIAEFHAAARRRHMWIFAVAGLLCIALGAVIVVVTIVASFATNDVTHTQARFEAKTFVAGLAFIGAGIGSGWKAIRTARGEHVE